MGGYVFLPVFSCLGRRWRVRLRFPGGWACWKAVDRFPEGTARRVRLGPILIVAMVDEARGGE